MGKIMKLLAAYAMAIGVQVQGYPAEADCRPARRDPWREEDEEGRKARLHRMNPTDTSEREFTVRGERIAAHDRRTALKIYARRHPEAKGRKKK